MGIKRVHRALASVAATALIAGVTVVGTTGVVEAARPNANVKENPDLAAACGTDVIIVLDESTSVGPYEADVSTATKALVNGLNGTGSRVRFVEFSTGGRNASIGGSTAFQTVNDTLITQVTTYLDSGGGTADTRYSPNGYTNWEAGLSLAATPFSDLTPRTNNVGAPLVIFITDGDPNTVGPPSNTDTNNGGGSDASADAAIGEMNTLQERPGHVLAIAVGNGVSSTTSFNRLTNLVEPHPASLQTWTGSGALDVRTVDALKVTDFSNLDDAISLVVFGLCAPSLTLTKTDQAGVPVNGVNFTTTVDVLKPAGEAVTDQFVWVKPALGVSPPVAATQTVATAGTGIATFQWTPYTLAEPKPWDSRVTFTETLQPGWTLDPATTSTATPACQVARLGVASKINVALKKESPAGTPVPGDTITFSFINPSNATEFLIQKSDIVTCTVKNQRPGTIKVIKQTLPNLTAGNFAFTTNFTVNEADKVLADNEFFTSTPLVPGTYTISEASVPGWDLDSLDCGQANLGTKSTTVTLGAGDNVVCTFTNRLVPAPQLQVTKTATPTSFQEPAGTVTYTVAVKNTGTEPITSVTALTDAVTLNAGAATNLNLALNNPGPAAGGTFTANTCDTDVVGKPIAAGATLTCTFTVSYTGRDVPDRIDDVVTATGKDKFDRTVSASDDARVDVTDVLPTIAVDKQNAGDLNGDVIAPGGTAQYSVKITNPVTAVEPLTITAVTDQLSRDAAGAPVTFANFGSAQNITVVGGAVTATTCGSLIGTVLVPGAFVSCNFSVNTLALGAGNLAQNDTLRNTITVTGADDDGNSVNGSDPADRTVPGAPPQIGVFKTDNGAEITEPGTQITYDIDIYNRGTTESLTIKKITDSVNFFLNSAGPGVPVGTVTIGDGLGGNAVVSTLPGAPGASLVSTTCAAKIGFVLAPAAGLDVNGRPTNAAAITTCQIVLQLPANAPDKYSDTVTVDAADFTGDPVTGSNSAETPGKNVMPALTITKTPSPTSVPESGGSVVFTFVIKNTSPASTDPVTLTALVDSRLGNLFGAPAANVTVNNCLALLNTVLAPNATVQCTVTATLVGDVALPHTNTITVTGKDDEQNETSATADARVDFSDVKPTVDVTKTDGGASVAEPGGTVTYTLTIQNTSFEKVNVTTLTDTVTYAKPAGSVTYDLLNPVAPVSDSDCQAKVQGGLDPGQTITCSFKLLLTGTAQTVSDEVKVVVTDNDNSTGEDKATETTPITDVKPTVDITKTDGGAFVNEPGGTVTYTVEIINPSAFEAVTVTALTDTIQYAKPLPAPAPIVVDLLAAASGPMSNNTCLTQLNAVSRILAPNAKITCTFDIALTGTSQLVADRVDVTVVDDEGSTDTDNAVEDTPIKDVAPAVEVVKTASPTQIQPGESVAYTFTVFNRSTIEPLKVLTLTDDKFGDLAGVADCDLAARPWLTPNDGNDAAGTDQFTCTISRQPAGGPAADHVNVVTVTAADDEILAGLGAVENPTVPVTDTDDATVLIRKKGSIKVIKSANPNTGTFSFTLAPGNTQPVASGQSYTWTGLNQGSYDLTELVPAGYQLDSVSCGTGTPLAFGKRIALAWGDDVVCTFSNTQLGAVVPVKTIKSGPTQQPGTNLYDVVYEITVTNNSYRAETFEIVDELGIAGDVTVHSIGTITKPASIDLNAGWNGESDTELTDGPQPIAGRGASPTVLTITVPVTFEVPGTTTIGRECLTGPVRPGGALNSVDLESSAGDLTTEVCKPFDDPNLALNKSLVGKATRNAAGLWTIVYDITVANSGKGAGNYDLTDELRFGAGVQVQSVDTAVHAVSGQVSPPTDADLNPGFNGGALLPADTAVISDVEIVAGASHTYRLTVTARIDDPVVNAGQCDPTGAANGGFLNSASITGSASKSAFACDNFSTLRLNKVVDNSNGANSSKTDFTLTATGNAATGNTVVSGQGSAFQAVPAGTYSLSETDIAAYDTLGWVCSGVQGYVESVVVAAGQDASCEITNNSLPIDLQLVKGDAGVTAIAGGSSFTYTITVTNVGTRDADALEPITVVDELPAAFTWVTLPTGSDLASACVQAGQKLTCLVKPSSLGAGESVVLSATVQAAATVAAGVYTNKAYVTTQDDPVCVGVDCVPPPCPTVNTVNPSNNLDCEDTPVDRAATITVIKDDSKDPVLNGDTFDYTLKVTNNGPSVVSNVALVDDLPAGLTLVSTVGGAGWTCNAVDPVSCTYAPVLGAGATTPVVTVKVTVDQLAVFAADTIVNRVDATAFVDKLVDGPAENLTDDDTETTSLTRSINVDAFTSECVADAPFIVVDIETLGFDPTLDADGKATVTLRFYGFKLGVRTFIEERVIKITPDASGDLLANTLYPGASLDAFGNPTDWPGWMFQGGMWVVDPTDDFYRDGLEIEVSVNPTATATVTYPDGTTACGDPLDLKIEKNDFLDGISGEEAVAIAGGDPIDYTITVTNIGVIDADLGEPVTVVDQLPAAFTWVTLPTGADLDGACVQAGQLLTCQIKPASMGAGDTVVLTATVKASGAQASGTFTNKAYVTTEDDPVCSGDGCVPPPCPLSGPGPLAAVSLSNNVACEDTPVERKATITVVKADGGVTVHPGDAFDYTFVVTNNGPSTVTDVGLADVLPSGLSVTGVAGAGWTCAAGPLFPCEWAGTLASGQSTDVLTVSVELDIDYVGSDLLNTVDADALVDDLGDTDPSNDDRATDTDDETTPVVIEADMSIVKTVTDASPDAGGASFDWVLTVTNEGPDTARNVVVTDTVPAPLVVSGAITTAGTCDVVGNAVSCDLGDMVSLATATITITASLPLNASLAEIVNVGTVSSDTDDPDPENNEDDEPVTPVRASLTLHKVLNQDNGGNATLADFVLTATPAVGSPVINAADPDASLVVGAAADVAPGTFTLTETDVPGYEGSSWVCTGGAVTADGVVTVPSGTDVVCTITNDDVAPTITLYKVVDNANGGDLAAGDFQLTLNDGDAAQGVALPTAANASNVIDEDLLAGYEQVSVECFAVGTTTPNLYTDGITLDEGQDVYCNVTNRDLPVDLEIDKGDGDVTAVAGGAPFDYTITVSNIGDRDVDADEPVTVTDELPAGMSFVLPLPAGCAAVGQTLTCDIDPALLQVGDDPVVITITISVAPGAAPGEYTNKAFVTTEDDPICEGDGECPPPPCPADQVPDRVAVQNASNNVDCEDTPVDPSADLTVVKDVTTAPVQDGAGVWTVGYTVKVTNSSPTWSTTATVDDVLKPGAGVTITSASVSGPGASATWNGTTDTRVVTGRVLAGGESLTYVVTVKATSLTTLTTTASNCLLEGSETGTGFLNVALASNGTTTVTDDACAEVPAPTWTMVKSSVPADGATVRPGDVVTYTLTVTNTSQALVREALVIDDLSDVLDDSTLAPLGAGLTLDGTKLTWAVPFVAPGASATVSYSVTVSPGAWGHTLRNVATPGTDGGTCPVVDDCATVHPVPSWSLTKKSNPPDGSVVQPGTEVTYTLTVTNTSGAVVAGAVVIDDMSKVLAHAKLVGSLPADVLVANTTLVWNVPTLQPGASVSLSYTVRINDDAFNAVITNAVTPEPGSGGQCVNICTTTTNTSGPAVEPPTQLPATGAEVFHTLQWSLTLMALGVALLVWRRRQGRLS